MLVDLLFMAIKLVCLSEQIVGVRTSASTAESDWRLLVRNRQVFASKNRTREDVLSDVFDHGTIELSETGRNGLAVSPCFSFQSDPEPES